MKSIIDLQLWQLIAAYVFVLILMLIVKLKGIPREKEILISSVRMTIQLILTGCILVYLFNTPSPLYTILILIAMEVFSVYNIIKRIKVKLSLKLKQIIALSMIVGTVSCLLYFLFVVVRISPWYESPLHYTNCRYVDRQFDGWYGDCFFTWHDDWPDTVRHLTCHSDRISNCDYAWNTWQCSIDSITVYTVRL